MPRSEPDRLTPLRDGLDLVLLDVSYADGTPTGTRCWSAGTTAADRRVRDVATIGTDGDRTAYDALYDPDAPATCCRWSTVGDRRGLRFVKEPDAELPVDAAPGIGAEQSNTSVVFEDAASSRCSAGSRPGSTRTSS